MKSSLARPSAGAQTRRHASALFFIVLPVLLALSSCNGGSTQRTEGDAYDRVMRSGRIRVGYISYPPSFIKDPNTGAYSGIFHEVLQQAAQNLSLKVDYVEELGWGTMVEAISSGRVDLVCTGLWPTAGRARRGEFSTPIYFSAVRAYVRVDDKRFDGDLSRANSPAIKIATIDGEMTSIIARSDFRQARPSSLPQSVDVSQVLLDVATRKADLTFVEAAVGEAYIARNPKSVRAVQGVGPVRVFPNVLMVGKGEFRLLSMLNAAIEELSNNGLIDPVISKYEQFPGSFLRRQPPYK